MHMEGYAYNWYLRWKRDNFTYTWNLFKNDFFYSFQGIKEDEFFSKLTRVKQVRNVEEFTHQWESLSTWVVVLSDKQRLETYLGGLKPYLQKELKLHDIPKIEVVRHKEKFVGHKLEGIKTKWDSHYWQEKETQCRYYADTGSPGHQCHKPQSYTYEMENRSKSSNGYSDNKKKNKKNMSSMRWWLDLWSQM